MERTPNSSWIVVQTDNVVFKGRQSAGGICLDQIQFFSDFKRFQILNANCFHLVVGIKGLYCWMSGFFDQIELDLWVFCGIVPQIIKNKLSKSFG